MRVNEERRVTKGLVRVAGSFLTAVALACSPIAAFAEEPVVAQNTDEPTTVVNTNEVQDATSLVAEPTLDEDANQSAASEQEVAAAVDDAVAPVSAEPMTVTAKDDEGLSPEAPKDAATTEATATEPAAETAIETEATQPMPNVVYKGHVQRIGWQEERRNGELAGTEGMSLRMESMQIWLIGANGEQIPGISYKAHVQGYGWMDWVGDGAIGGTTGESKRIEALKVKLSDELAQKYDVLYRVHIQTYGWLDWTSNGMPAGSTGRSRRIEAIEIKLQEKGDAPVGSNSYVDGAAVMLSGHVQRIGWQGEQAGWAGTTGQSLRMEAVTAHLNAAIDGDAGIEYQAHVQTYGWQGRTANGGVAGTSGESKRVEAFNFTLTGVAEELYDIYYRAHIQSIGWLGWACNGQNAGSQDFSRRMEALEVRLVPKGSGAPSYDGSAVMVPFVAASNVAYDSTALGSGWFGTRWNGDQSGAGESMLSQVSASLDRPNSSLTGSLAYQVRLKDGDWCEAVTDGDVAGVEGVGIDGLRFSLSGELSGLYNVYYRGHLQGKGWLAWSKDGEDNTVTGLAEGIDAYNLMLVPFFWNAPSNEGSLYTATYSSDWRANAIDQYLARAVDIANDNSHGYSQPGRWGQDYDCSSLVVRCLQATGLPTGGATYTGDMLDLGGQGWDVMSFTSPSILKRGDILLTPYDHTEFYLGSGKNVRAWMSEYNSIDGNPGDQTGHEIEVVNYHNNSGRGWDYVLRLR